MATVRTVTVKSSGGDYTSLSAAESGEQGNLVTLDRQLDIECHNFEDTALVIFAGSTTDATRYIRVYAYDNHGGKWSTSSYRLVNDSTTYPLILNQNNIRVIGLQVSKPTQTASGCYRRTSTETNAGLVLIDKCIGYQPAGTSPDMVYMRYGPANTDIVVRNSLMISSGGGIGFRLHEDVGNQYSYNNTSFNCECRVAGTPVFINTVATGGYGFAGTWDSASDYNVSSDATAPGTHVAINKTSYTDYFVDYTNGDYHLKDTSYNLWGLAGTDLSGTFTDDIDGDTRSNWDIGADEYTSGGTTYYQTNYGSFPAQSGAINTAVIFGESVAGVLPAPSGNIIKLVGKGVIGSLDSPVGVLTKHHPRTVVGNAPAPSGSIDASLIFTQDAAGIMGSLSGGLTKGMFRLVTGNIPWPSGSITKSVGKGVSGTMGTIAGAPAKSTGKLVEGNFAAPTGTVGYVIVVVRALYGTMGTMTGSLDAALQAQQFEQVLSGVFGAITGGIHKLTTRSTAGDLPAASGGITKSTGKLVAGDHPTPTGDSTPTVAINQAVSGVMGVIQGVVTAIKRERSKVVKIIGACFKKFLQ